MPLTNATDFAPYYKLYYLIFVYTTSYDKQANPVSIFTSLLCDTYRTCFKISTVLGNKSLLCTCGEKRMNWQVVMTPCQSPQSTVYWRVQKTKPSHQTFISQPIFQYWSSFKLQNACACVDLSTLNGIKASAIDIEQVKSV